ncbi:MAG TPA: PP0621 family protein [Pyrinomonadaceae bacterium]|nr:PP0621 family protein [Pyrinomonadaceae bacterium]
MKYLIIVAIVSVVSILVYSRLRPYLQLIRQVLGALDASAEIQTAQRPRSPSKNKLVRCDSCGTWVPADRALRVSSGLANYCSRECLAQKAQTKQAESKTQKRA